MPSLESTRVRDQLLSHGLVVERRGAVDVEGPVGQPLGHPDRLGRSTGQPAGHLLERGLQRGPRHQPGDQADPVGLGGWDVVAEEEELLGLLDPDQSGQDPRSAGVGCDAAPDEHLDELGLLGHHDEVAGQGQVHAAPRRRAVDAGDDRLLAVEDGGHEALPAVPDHPRPVAHDVVGRVVGLGTRREPAATQVGAAAEGLLTGGRDHDHAHEEVRRRVADPGRDLVPHELGHGVARVGPVERDPADPVLNPAEQIVAGRALSRVAHRSPWGGRAP